jgi:hypothetical protein
VLSDPVTTCAARVRLNGSATDDDGDVLAYTWTGSFPTASGASATVTMPLGTQNVTLTVSDGKWHGTVSTTTSVNVTDQSPPTFTHVPDDKVVKSAKPKKVQLKLPDASDACSGVVPLSGVTAENNGNPVPVTLSKGAVSFDAPLGITTVTFSAQDGAGNVGSVSTTVTLAK